MLFLIKIMSFFVFLVGFSMVYIHFMLICYDNSYMNYISACIDNDPVINVKVPSHFLNKNFQFNDKNFLFEDIFLSVPSNVTAKAHLWRYTRQPHLAGSKVDYDLAEYTKNRLISYGIKNTVIEPVDVLLAEPISRSVNLIKLSKSGNKIIFSPKLSENILPGIDITSDTPSRNQTFLGYSPSGTAQARYVYANYGRPEDFDVLKEANVNVKNSIVIVRYGKCFRGLKVMNAQERGALAVLIYSDPADDGYSVGDIYP